MAFFGIERNTDHRDPQTAVKRFSSERAAVRWREATKIDGQYPRAYAADRRIREVYETSTRITERMVLRYLDLNRGSTYSPRTNEDARAALIRSGGVAVYEDA